MEKTMEHHMFHGKTMETHHVEWENVTVEVVIFFSQVFDDFHGETPHLPLPKISKNPIPSALGLHHGLSGQKAGNANGLELWPRKTDENMEEPDVLCFIEGSLETKVSTIWTDEKHSQEEAEPGRNSDV